MLKKPHARIDFKNCDTNYTYTICHFADVKEHIELVQQQAEDLDEQEANA